MPDISTLIFYIVAFLAIYVQVFFLITFLENRKKIKYRSGKLILSNYPSVTIVVPCWNEEETISKTLESLLAINYPKDKLSIFAIDDGSIDNTWQILQQFKSVSNIKIFKKDNGGKYSAMNFGLENSNTEFFGCLDADSFVDPEALKRIITYFEGHPEMMAVAPSIIVNEPKSIIQIAQRAEYNMSVYIKKMLGFVGGIHVTPGPFTIFRREVFNKIGNYRHAHNTEDMEIAYRMQKNHMKIDQCNDAFIYTNTPPTIKKLYKQRIRWIYGFLNNSIDYKDMIFRKKYGAFALFTVPSGVVSVIAATYLFGLFIYNIMHFLIIKIDQIRTVGFNFSFIPSNFDFFFINTKSTIFMTLIMYTLVITSIMIGKRMSSGKFKPSFDMLCFFVIYSVIAPFWLMKAVYNTILSKTPAWR